MPSRAVLRKKARREAKRSKQDAVKLSAPQPKPAPTRVVVERIVRPPPAKATPAPPEQAPHGGERSQPSPPQRPTTRREPELAREPIPEGLSRKERRREMAKRIFEKQLARVNAGAAAAAAAVRTTASDGDEATQPTPIDLKDRHDPRFSGGTFWKTRKERRARTLFLGGIPFNMTSQQVKDFINTVIDSDSLAVEYLNELAEGTDAVEEVDFLPIKHSKVRNTYVTFASVPIAGCAAAKLDGYKMDGRFLRCNFASDKTQRSIAINRRSVR